MTEKLKQSEIKALREQKLYEQNSVCPLCGTEILPEEAVLDHCHDSGHVRMVLHRACNAAEGRILNWVRRSRAIDTKKFLFNIISYISEDWSHNPVHPNYRTPKEKEIQKLKRKKKKLKTKKAKVRVQKQIEDLEDEREEVHEQTGVVK